MKLQIGTTEAGKPFTLPADAVTKTSIVYGGKGMGKTNFLSVFAEELHRVNRRFSILDPMGVCWGLRHGAEGKKQGIDILILGGPHGDIPILPTAGAVVADLVVDESISVVIDIKRNPDGSVWGVGERIRFVGDYIRRLTQRQGEKRRPLMQIIDEAARFAPQIIPHGSPDMAKCLGALETLVEEGRNDGIGVCLVTQRSARMAKSVSELADLMIAFRTVGPNSIDAVLDWLGEHIEKSRWKEQIAVLRSLPLGRALMVSPGWLNFEGIVQVRLRETFDSSATPDGGRTAKPGPARKPDLAVYRDRMAETIEAAAANDPKLLRKRIAELEKAKAPIALVPKPVTATVVDQSAIDRAVKAAVAPYKLAANKAIGELRVIRESLSRLESKAADAIQGLIDAGSISVVMDAATAQVAKVDRPAPQQSIIAGSGDASIGKGVKRKIMVALCQFPEGLSRDRLAALAGASASGGGYGARLSELRTAGFITDDGDRIVATPAGHEATGDYTPLPTGAALHDYWRGRIGGGVKRRIFDALIQAYPQSIRRAELAEACGASADGGGFGARLSELRTMGLIDGSGELKASAELFD